MGCRESLDCGFISENLCCRECWERGPACKGFCVFLIDPEFDYKECEYYHSSVTKVKDP